MQTATDFRLPVAFQFTVSFMGVIPPGVDGAFQEVSGFDAGFEVESVAEGGENRFVHKLPKPVKQGTLKLKRGLTDLSSPLALWCTATIQNGLSVQIQPCDLLICLLDEEGNPVASWTIGNAYPLKWSIVPFDAMKNEIAIETIELAYQTMQRTS